MIHDIRINFNNWTQDMGEQLDNESIITDELNAAAPTYEWSTIKRDAAGAWYRSVISPAQHLVIADVAEYLSNGVMLIELRATDPDSGRMWAKTMPSYFAHQHIQSVAPDLMPYPNFLTGIQWVQQAATEAWATPHVKGAHFIGGKVGDLDNNGVVNTADLLLFTGKFGS